MSVAPQKKNYRFKIISLLVLIIIIGVFSLYSNFVQTKIARYAIANMEKKLGVKISFSKLNCNLFSDLNLYNLVIFDKKNDTLLSLNKLSVSVTDWFFLQKQPAIHFIDFEGLRIFPTLDKNNHYNFEFIQNLFTDISSTSSNSTASTSWNIQKINIRNLYVDFQNRQDSSEKKVYLKNAKIVLDSSNFISQKFDLALLQLENPEIIEIDRKIKPKNEHDNIKDIFNQSFQLPKLEFDLKLKVFNIINLNYSQYKKSPDSNSDIYTPTNILSKVNLKLTESQLLKNKFSSHIESNGDVLNHNVDKLNFDFIIKNEVVAVKNITIQSEHSRVFADCYFSLSKPLHSQKITLKNINYKLFFKLSTIKTDNLLSMLKMNHIISKDFINIDGNIEGCYDVIQANQILIGFDKTNYLKSSFQFSNIFDSNELKFFVKVEKSKGNFIDLKKSLPFLKNYQFTLGDSFGNFEFAGDLTYFKKMMDINGLFTSTNGSISSNVKLNLANIFNPSYSGEIKSTKLNLGLMFNIQNLGLINFNGKVKGSGLSLDNLKAELEGNLDHFNYQKYSFNKVSINGTLSNKIYNGNVKITDSLIDLEGYVNINLKESLPQYSFDGTLHLLNLNLLKIPQKNIKIHSNISFKFKGNQWDNLNTKLYLDDITLSKDKSVYNINYFKAEAEKTNSNNYVYNIESDFLETSLESSVPINLFMPNFQQIFFKYLTKFYVDSNITINPNFAYNLNYRIKKPIVFFQIFDYPFSGLENMTLKSGFSSNKSYFLNLNIPNFNFKNIKTTNINLDISENNNALHSTLKLGSLKYDTNVVMKNILYYSYLSNNQQLFNISTTNKSTLFNLSIQGIIDFVGRNNWHLKMNPSWIQIKNNNWVFDDNGTIKFENGVVDFSNFNITNGDESVQLTSSSNIKNKQVDIVIQFVNIHLNEILNLIVPKYNIKGTLDGNVYVHFNNKSIEANTLLNFHKLQIDKDSIGLVNTFIEFDSLYNVRAQILSNNPHYNFSANGYFNILDQNSVIETNIEMRDLSATLLTPLLSDVFYNISGSMKGKLHFNGNLSKPVITGDVEINRGTVGVLFSNVIYNFDTSKFVFLLNELQIIPSTIFDKNHNPAIVEGTLTHDYFNFFTYNITVFSPKLMILNTVKNPNDYFYGTVFGKIDFKITGNDDNMLFDIASTTLDNTNFYIQNINHKESFEDDLIKFSKGPSFITKPKDILFHTKINYDLRLNIQNSSNIYVVLDEVSNDVISGNGTGDLHITGSTLDPLNIQGIYNIEQGKYDINFQSLLKTTFILQPNQNNYIEWTNKPLEATVNIEAVYKTQPVSLADLLGNASFSQNIKSYKGIVYIVAILKDKLNNPKIHFRLDFPPDAPILTNNDFNQFLKQLESNENEMLKQVGFLILFQSFAPIGNIAGSFNTENYNYSNIGFNTLSKIISNQMNQILSTAFNKITKDKTFSFDFGTSFYNSSNLISQNTGLNTGNSNTIDRNRVNIKVSKSFLNDKIVLSFDPGLDFNLGSTTYSNQSVEFLPNINLDLALTKDKKLKLILFSNSSLDYTGLQFGKRNRQGIRLSFQRDFK